MTIVKRSLTIAGHSTSISLEEPFWQELRGIAASRGVPLAALVSEIDTSRPLIEGRGNLSSALRLYVLETLKAQRA